MIGMCRSISGTAVSSSCVRIATQRNCERAVRRRRPCFAVELRAFASLAAQVLILPFPVSDIAPPYDE